MRALERQAHEDVEDARAERLVERGPDARRARGREKRRARPGRHRAPTAITSETDQRRHAAARQHAVVDLQHEERAREIEQVDHAAHQADADEGVPAAGEGSTQLGAGRAPLDRPRHGMGRRSSFLSGAQAARFSSRPRARGRCRVDTARACLAARGEAPGGNAATRVPGLLLRDQALDDDVVARSAVEDVEPGPPISTSSPSPPSRMSLPSPPIRTSSPSPPSAVSWIAPAASPEASITSSPRKAVDDDAVVRGLEA